MTTEEKLKRKVQSRNIVIVILLIGLAFSAYFVIKVHFHDGAQNFNGHLQQSVGANNVRELRKWPQTLPHSSHGVWYEADSITNYMKNIYPQLIASQKNPDPKTYKWVVGFYWMMKKDPNSKKDRRDFCVVPTLVNINTGQVLDYYDDQVTSYNRTVTFPPRHQGVGRLGERDTGLAYNAGHLWP